MPKIKLTKSELKTQRDALKQFQRFLPTLQLKKQQLQLELSKSREQLDALRRSQTAFLDSLDQWSELFGETAVLPILENMIEIETLSQDLVNIAGVKVPVFIAVKFRKTPMNYYETDPWMDDAVAALEKVVEYKIRRLILEEQYNRLEQELRVTTQRVNLFEKVKIPECKENIRVIQIALGDEQTASVGKSKMAKKKLMEVAV